MPFSIISAALVAVLVGFGGTLAIIVAAARNLGADGAEIASWIWALCMGMAVSSVYLSWRTRTPTVTAWSLAGAVLLAGLPPGTAMGSAVAAFVFSGVLTLLSGLVPALGNLVARLPASLGAAMLAGLLLRFVLLLFQSLGAEPLLVLPLLALFLVARFFHAASAPLVVLAVGLPFAALLGHPVPVPDLGLATPRFTMPAADLPAVLGLGLPLFLVTMATQQIPGAAVLRVAGYEPPMRLALLVTGGLTVLLAPFGGYSVNLSSITAAICTGVDAHPDPAQRWKTGLVYGLGYLLIGIVGAGIASTIAGLPPVLVTVVAGTALLGPLTNALAAATATVPQRFAAVTAFGVTASGLSVLGLGSAFWGLVAGVLVLGVERLERRRAAA